MIDTILATLLAIVAVLGAGGTVWGFRKGKKDAEGNAAKDTLDRFNAGQDRKRDSTGDPADRVRDNDAKW